MTLRARRASNSGTVLRTTLTQPVPEIIRAFNVNESLLRWPRRTM